MSTTMAPWAVPEHMRKPRQAPDPARAPSVALAPVWVEADELANLSRVDNRTFNVVGAPLGRATMLARIALGLGHAACSRSAFSDDAHRVRARADRQDADVEFRHWWVSPWSPRECPRL